MAEATKVAAVTETKVVEVEPEKVVLKLTVREAQAIRHLTGRIVKREYELSRLISAIYSSLTNVVDMGTFDHKLPVTRLVEVRKDVPW